MDTNSEYMQSRGTTLPLKTEGLNGAYQPFVDFNGTVLTGHPTQYGIQFVTRENLLRQKTPCVDYYRLAGYGEFTLWLFIYESSMRLVENDFSVHKNLSRQNIGSGVLQEELTV